MLTSGFYIILMTVFTLFALFGDDLKYLIVPEYVNFRTTDEVFSILTVICIVVFSVEILMQIYADRRDDEGETLKTLFINRYYLSFYFWLDILSTASLLLDVTWLISAILSI